MNANNRLIVAERAGRDLVAHDIVEPSLEKFGDVDITHLKKVTIVDPPTQLLKLPNDLRPLLRRHVLPLRFARGVIADMRNTHPKTIGLTLVDRAFMI